MRNIATRLAGRLLGSGNAFTSTHMRIGAANVALKVASTAAGLLLSVVVARLLGPSEFGSYAFVFALITMLTVPVQLGLPSLVLRETAKLQALSAWGEMRSLWIWAALAVAVISLLVLAIGLLLVSLGDPAWRSAEGWVYVAGLLLVPFSALVNIIGSASTGLRHVIRGGLPDRIFRPLLLMALIGAGLMLNADWVHHAQNVMGLHVAATALALVAALIMLRGHSPAQVLTVQSGPQFKTREWATSALPFALVGGLQIIMSNGGILLLGLFRSPEEVGLYRVVVTASSLVIFGLPVFQSVAAPYIARYHTQKAHDRLQQMMTMGSRAALVLSLPTALVLLLFGQQLLTFVYGPAYAEAYIPLVILVLGQLVNATTGSASTLLNMSGHQKETARIVMASVIVNCLLCLVLIPWLGMSGAAVALSLSIAVLNVAVARTAWKRLGIRTSIFGKVGDAF